jgi:hypothetical protein
MSLHFLNAFSKMWGMSDTNTLQYTQLELPFGEASQYQFRPYITIGNRDVMEGADTYSTEADAAAVLFFHLNTLQIVAALAENSKFELTRRDSVSFTAYLYTPTHGAEVVRGGLDWLEKSSDD